MNYGDKFYKLLELSDNLKTGAFDQADTPASERGFHLESQCASLDVIFDPETQDWTIKYEYDDDFSVENDTIKDERSGNGFAELIDCLWSDELALTWFMNMTSEDVKSIKECVVVTESTESQEDAFKRIFKPGNKLVAAKDIYYGDIDNLFWEEPEVQKFEKLGFIKDGKCIFPRGTRFTAVSDKSPSGWPSALLNKTGEEFDFAFDDEPDNVFIVLSESVITEDPDDAFANGNPNVINDEHDAAAFMECIDWEPLNKFIGEIIGTTVNFKASNVRAARGYSGNAQYYVDVADSRNFADECGIMSPVYRDVFIDCFNSAICKDKETGESYFWCTPAFRYNYKSGGSNGTNIATAVYKNGQWVRMEKDWSDIR